MLVGYRQNAASLSSPINVQTTFLCIVAIELVFLLGVILRVDYFNGSPYYWRWIWRPPSYFRAAFYLSLPLIPYFYALYKTRKVETPQQAHGTVRILMASNVLFQLIGIGVEAQPLELLKSIIVSRGATSYFYDASHIHNLLSFFENFHILDLRGHSSTHPPGPILYYFVFIHLFGTNLGAYIGGLLIAILASAGIFVLYLLSSLWTDDLKTRLTICTYYALIPGLILFFPQLDQAYPILSMLLIYFWEMSLRRSRIYAIYFGLVLWVASFFAYNLLVIGAFHALSAFILLRCSQNVAENFRILLHTALLALGTATVCYLGLFWLTAFNPLHSFARAGCAEFSLLCSPETAELLCLLQLLRVFFGIWDDRDPADRRIRS